MNKELVVFERDTKVKIFETNGYYETKEIKIKFSKSLSFGVSTKLKLIAYGSDESPYDIRVVSLDDKLK